MISELKLLQEKRYEQIDFRTSEILEYGFTYDEHRFEHKLSDNVNYIDIMIMRDCLTYPQPINTAVSGIKYNLVDSDAVIAFSSARCQYKQAVRATGYVLKVAISECTTIEQVNAIIDDRPLEYVAIEG
jgi:hypothetical protein